MAAASYRVKVPGSIMLFGEHAVLQGKPTVVAAINKYITATLSPRQDKVIHLASDLLGHIELDLNGLRQEISQKIKTHAFANWRFVLASVFEVIDELTCGFNLKIEAEFSANLGFGSSAVVTVATLAILKNWLNQCPSETEPLIRLARKVIIKSQGIGSGADAAASILGGVIIYQVEPLSFEKIGATLPLTLVYSGRKKSTVEVVHNVLQLKTKYPSILNKIYDSIEQCVLAAKAAIVANDWQEVGEIMNLHQGLQESLGVTNRILNEIILGLREDDGIWGAKISGAGLGDCAIGVGNLNKVKFPQSQSQSEQGVLQIPVTIDSEGIQYLDN